MTDAPFWETKSLDEMSREEWESLCDGCGKCCLIKLEDEDTGDIYQTDVVCKLFNADTCQCGDYPRRHLHVPDCVILNPDNVSELHWMPETCAYRLLANGQPLAPWHPLVSGDPDSIHQAGISVRNRVTSEALVDVDDLPDRIVDW